MGFDFSKVFSPEARAQRQGISPEELARRKQEATTVVPITDEQFNQYQQTNGAAFPGQYAIPLEDYGGKGYGLIPLETVHQMWNSQPREGSGGFMRELADNITEMKGGLRVLAAPLFAGALGGAEGVGAAGTVGEFGAEPVFGSGAFSGSEGVSSMMGGAGNDTLMPPAQAEGSFPQGNFTDIITNDPSYLTDPSYWNPLGGTEGLAPPGAEGIPGETVSYGSNDYLQQALDLAKQYGITPSSALPLLLKAAGRSAPAALGVAGSKNQANSLSALAEKYMAFGEPSRARYEASYAPGFTMENEPGYKDALDQTTKATLHGLSVGGNPAGSPNAWAKTLEDVNAKFAFPALQNFRGINANAGGIASFAPAGVNAATSAIGAEKGIYDAIGGGINDIFSPKKSLAEQLIELKRAGVY